MQASELSEKRNEARAFITALGNRQWMRFDTAANRQLIARYLRGVNLPLSAGSLLVAFGVLAAEGLLEVVPESQDSRVKPVSEFLKSLDQSADDPDLAAALAAPVLTELY